MPVSIPKAQASALAENFLDTTSSSSKDVVFSNTISELQLLAAEFIKDAQNNLIQSNSVSSGELSNSLEAYNPPIQTGSVVKIDITMLPYGEFINSGVKGTKSGFSTAGYAFQYDKPSRKMVNEIQKWIKRLSLGSKNIKVASSEFQKKKKAISQLNLGRQVAYAVARSVVQKGIKATGFLDAAVKTTEDKIADRLGAAFEIDIITSLTR